MNSNVHASLKAMWQYSHSWFRWSWSNASFWWMVIYPEQVGARPSVAQIMMINSTISCNTWIPDVQTSMMAKWYTKVATHSRPISVILVKSQLLINVTLPQGWGTGPWTGLIGLWYSNNHFIGSLCVCDKIAEGHVNALHCVQETLVLVTSQLSMGPPYFHHCWEKLNKSSIDAITHRFAPTSRYWCTILALTSFESYPLMGLPPVPVTSRPYSSSSPMAIISKLRSEHSWLTKHLVGCATFTPTPTTATCCP